MAEFIIELDPSLYPESAWATLTEPMDEVFRCRDCRHYRRVREGGMVFCTKHSYIAEPDGYCKWGERKDDETA